MHKPVTGEWWVDVTGRMLCHRMHVTEHVPAAQDHDCTSVHAT